MISCEIRSNFMGNKVYKLDFVRNKEQYADSVRNTMISYEIRHSRLISCEIQADYFVRNNDDIIISATTLSN
ncbi:hypothetical protein HanRHA438_Chr11g0521751 [Helianthus annuus]|nr:hypothetical protein HanRHA438_Chr11g0521751 [Helianthus annuus]